MTDLTHAEFELALKEVRINEQNWILNILNNEPSILENQEMRKKYDDLMSIAIQGGYTQTISFKEMLNKAKNYDDLQDRFTRLQIKDWDIFSNISNQLTKKSKKFNQLKESIDDMMHDKTIDVETQTRLKSILDKVE